MHRCRAGSAGERLCQHVHGRLHDDEKAWRYLENVMRSVGDGKSLSAYYKLHAAVFLSCKLISAGKSVSNVDEVNPPTLAAILDRYSLGSLNSGNRLLRLLVDAVAQCDRPISPGVAREMRAFARAEHSFCYICGVRLDFSDATSRSCFTLDHLWPACYGGNSVPENILPACSDCNTKKANFAAWVSTDVHSLFLGMNPDQNHLDQLQFRHRYSLFNRAAFSLAIARERTIKEAFLELGPWVNARVEDTTLATDMFNIVSHQPLVEF
jgi:hypothetical protein